MKKNILYTILLVTIMIIPKLVFAADLQYDFEINNSNDGIVLSSGEEITLRVVLTPKSKETFNSCSFSLVTPQTGASFVEISPSNQYELSDNNGVYTISFGEGLAEANSLNIIANIKYTVTGNADVKITNITCNGENSSGTHSDVEYSLKVDKFVVKIDGEVVLGNIISLSSNKTSFLLSAESADSSIQSDIKVYANIDVSSTPPNEVLLCQGDEAKNCTVDFVPSNFCISSNCKSLNYGHGSGDNIEISIRLGNDDPRLISVIREVSQAIYSDSSISSLKVFGQIIDLIDGQTEYAITVPSNLETYSIEAVLSDSEHYSWDDDDNPDKYNFPADTVNLIVRPKDSTLLGGNEKVYVVHVTYEGELPSYSSSSSSSSVSSSSSSSSETPIIVSSSEPSSSYNPQTGKASEVIVTVILVISLISSVVMYSKNKTMYE